MKAKKDNRGGARLGAGRPAAKDPKETIYILVRKSIIKALGKKQIKTITEVALDRAKKNFDKSLVDSK